MIRQKFNRALSIASKKRVNILSFPEITIDESFLNDLREYAEKENMIIIGGSYYDKKRKNISPIIIKPKIFYVEKKNLPLEKGVTQDDGATPGENGIIIKNSQFGSIGVLICADFLDESLRNEILNENVDFLFIPSLNKQSDEFFGVMNTIMIDRYRQDKKCPYIIYSNSIHNIWGDGKSSIFGFVDKNVLSKLENVGCKPKDHFKWKLVQIDYEGMIIADLAIEKSPTGIHTIKSTHNIENVIKYDNFIKKK